jgi:23S rRNA A2030 N6-methylase RlmJ
MPLAEILRLRPPRHYWETHAGSASYPLTETAARQHGVFHFLAQAATDPELAGCSYFQELNSLPGLYPGSPMLAMRALRQEASYIFCDIDPESAGSLRGEVAHLDARVIEGDGVAFIAAEARRGQVDPAEVLVLVDPFFPHERLTPDSETPLELAGSLAAAGYRVILWYAYFKLEERGWARQAMAELAPGVSLWCGDAIMPLQFTYPERSGLFGCGIVLANASEVEKAACRKLGKSLERISAADKVQGNDPPKLFFQVMQ